jgi:DNA transformation protein
MTVTSEYLAYVVDQLGEFGTVSARRMFGGAGLYRDDLFFGLIADDILYLKVDESNRPDYEAAGMGPFRPFHSGKNYMMGFYEVPADVLEEAEELARWASKACAVAQRKRASGTRRSRGPKR